MKNQIDKPVSMKKYIAIGVVISGVIGVLTGLFLGKVSSYEELLGPILLVLIGVLVVTIFVAYLFVKNQSRAATPKESSVYALYFSLWPIQASLLIGALYFLIRSVYNRTSFYQVCDDLADVWMTCIVFVLPSLMLFLILYIIILRYLFLGSTKYIIWKKGMSAEDALKLLARSDPKRSMLFSTSSQAISMRKYIEIGLFFTVLFSFVAPVIAVFIGSVIAAHSFSKDYAQASTQNQNSLYALYGTLLPIAVILFLIIAVWLWYFFNSGGNGGNALVLILIAVILYAYIHYGIMRKTFAWYTRISTNKGNTKSVKTEEVAVKDPMLTPDFLHENTTKVVSYIVFILVLIYLFNK